MPASFIQKKARVAATLWRGRRMKSRSDILFVSLTDRSLPSPAQAKIRTGVVKTARDEKRCCIRLVMLEARNAIATVLDNRTLAEMRMLAESDEENLMYCI